MALSGYVAGASADFLIKSGFSVALVRKIMQVTATPEIRLVQHLEVTDSLAQPET
jgi:hypothetical protein